MTQVAIAPEPFPPAIVTVGGKVYPYPVFVMTISLIDNASPTDVVIATAVAVRENSSTPMAPVIVLTSTSAKSGDPRPGGLIVTVGIPV